MHRGTVLHKTEDQGDFKFTPLMIPIEKTIKMTMKGFLKNLNLTGVVSQFIVTNEQKKLSETYP